MTRIKICGITNLEDGLFAAGLGADALGFNFYRPSPRYVNPATAASIVERIESDILTVGVFVNEQIETIAKIAAEARITVVQLHGDESPEYIGRLRSAVDLEIMKAFRVAPGFRISTMFDHNVNTVLLDSFSSAEFGGTGETFEWTGFEAMQELFPRFFLAGGLDEFNVREAIERLNPYGVDACSRLESARGKKDPAKVAAFFEQVRSI